LIEVINKYESYVPENLFISERVNITRFRTTDLIIDEEAFSVKFNPNVNGLYIRIINIVQWTLGVDWSIWFWGNNYLQGPMEYNFRNFSLNTGLKFEDTGLKMSLFEFFLYEGDSVLYLGDNFFMNFIAGCINYTFKPLSLTADIAFAPTVNFLFDNILEPFILHSGEIILPFDFLGFGDLEYDINLGFSQKPKITNDSLEIFLDGGISVLGEENEYPKKPLRFIDDEDLGF
jgi:hypothetical protein